jgi:hypothetical protein
VSLLAFVGFYLTTDKTVSFLTLSPWACDINLFTALCRAAVFVTARLFCLSLIFESNAGVFSSGHLRGGTLWLEVKLAYQYWARLEVIGGNK